MGNTLYISPQMAMVTSAVPGLYRTGGGRHSVSGMTATVFGSSGFLGKYAVSKLGAMGCRLILPYRGDELFLRHLKPMGDLGAINFQRTSIRSLSDIEASVAESNVVINLLGADFETRCAIRAECPAEILCSCSYASSRRPLPATGDGLIQTSTPASHRSLERSAQSRYL